MSRGITFTREQVEEWVGHKLTDEQVAQLEETLPHSSLPQSVEAVAHEALGFLNMEPDEYGLVGMQRERYEALVEHVGHDAALKDARKWPTQ